MGSSFGGLGGWGRQHHHHHHRDHRILGYRAVGAAPWLADRRAGCHPLAGWHCAGTVAATRGNGTGITVALRLGRALVAAQDGPDAAAQTISRLA